MMSSSESDYQHALAILDEADSWGWRLANRLLGPNSQSSFSRPASRLLYHTIKESRKFPESTILEQFWVRLRECHETFPKNIDILKSTQYDHAAPSRSAEILLGGIPLSDIDFYPVIGMADNIFTHLGIAFMNPGGKKSALGTPFSVSHIISQKTEELLKSLASESGSRKQVFLKALAFKRDGYKCLITNFRFKPHHPKGLLPQLAHIVPHSVHGKVDILENIGMFAGVDIMTKVAEHLNTPGNVMNLQFDAHREFDSLTWGIEAVEQNEQVRYFFRCIPSTDGASDPIAKRDGDEIMFGRGEDGSELDGGPDPILCNLHLAIARLMKMSGAADVIDKWKEDADDSEIPHNYLATEDFFNILDAGLYLTGRVTLSA